jgi:hypothetical protein
MAQQVQPSTGLTSRQRYQQLQSALLTERSSFDAHWRELADYLFPRRTRFMITDRNKGDRRTQNIINSTPRFAIRTLQSGLHAGVTSPARPWMRLTTPDPDLAEHGPVKEWLHIVTNRMLTVFARSNIYDALPTLYGDLGAFATGAMGIVEDDRQMIRAYTYPVGSYVVAVDNRGIATTFIRDYQFTCLQLIQEFGVEAGYRDIRWERFSPAVKTAWDNSRYEQGFDVTWVVTTNDDYDGRRLEAKDSMPWSSCWFEKGQGLDGRFLRESGFQQFPVMVPRWDVTGEDTYGTDCPGMTALGDIKGLQVLERRSAQAIDKALNPPLVGPPSLRTQKTSLLPGDITYDDAASRGASQGGLRPIHEVRLEGVEQVERKIALHEQRINRAFYADLFLMLSQSDGLGVQPITAEEVRERHEEKLLALGPVLERLNGELLNPAVDRVFAIMARAGAVPQPPDELLDLALKVEYTSVMSQAQKLVGVVGLDRFLQSSLSLATVFPDARHKVRVFQAIDDYAEMLGVNPKLVVPNDEAAAAVQAEQAAIAQEKQAEQAQQLANAGAALGRTPVGGNTALDAVLNGVQ